MHENGFAFCPEITTKIGNLNIKIKEIPISYEGRSVNEGKKINFIDGLIAIKAIFQYRFLKKNWHIKTLQALHIKNKLV